MKDIDGQLAEYRDEYLLDKHEIGVYRKSKRYSRLGRYLSAALWYFAAVFYFQFWPQERLLVVSVFVISLIVSFLTVMLYQNYKSSDIDETVVSYHDIADLIDTYEKEGYDKIVDRWDEIEENIVKNNRVLSKERRSAFDSYMSEVKRRGEDFADETLNDSLLVIVGDAKQVSQKKIEVPEEPASSESNQEPSGIDVIRSSVSSDYLNSSFLFWTIFIMGALVGGAVAIWKGEGWGVLVVTILFGALRFYDNRTN